MRIWRTRTILATSLITLSTTGVMAQSGGRRVGGDSPNDPTYLLASESVLNELKLSDEQALRLQRLRDEEEQSAQTFFRGMIGMSQEQIQARLDKRAKAERAKIAKVLTPEQMQRLNEINLQAAGTSALGFEEVAGAIGLTADQRKQLRELGEASRRQLTELYMANDSERKVGQNQEERKRKQQEITAERTSKALAVLTDAQKEKFAALQGKPFDLSTIQPRQRKFTNRGRIEAPPVIRTGQPAGE
jgi:Spy/CpxP family protein refolding chaperone